MKKIAILLLLILPFFAHAQNKHEQIEAAKIGIITNRLNLTSEQSTHFWTIYNEYDDRRKEMRKSIKRSIEDAISYTSTDEKILQTIKDFQNMKEKEIDLEREYMPKFLKVISVRQYAEMLRTERNFNQFLINQLNEKRLK